MTAIRALVADDEPLARAGMARLVRATAGFEVAGEARDGEEAISAIEALRPDLVLLDVQMPGRDGFEVIRAVGPARMPRVVFVTAYDAFAVRAFEVQALRSEPAHGTGQQPAAVHRRDANRRSRRDAVRLLRSIEDSSPARSADWVSTP